MAGTFDRYLLGAFLARTALILAGLAAILSVFDLLANAGDVMQSTAPLVWVLPAYAGLRLPGIVALLVPLATLIGALVTLAQFVAGSEMVAIRAAGQSPLRIAGVLLAGAGVLAVAHFALAETLVPDTAARLRLWQDRGYAGLPPHPGALADPGWFAADRTLVFVSGVSRDGTRLADPIVIRRDARGRLTGYLTARSARYEDGHWMLQEVARPLAEGDAGRLPRQPVALALDPRRFSALAGPPDSLTFRDMLALQDAPGASRRPPGYYRFWIQRKLAAPASCLVMALLAAPLAAELARRRRLAVTGLVALGGGFLYFIAERLLVPLGESGALPGPLAAWAPAGVFACLALWRLVMQEG